MVVIVYGLPGSGKSFFAARLAARLEAVYINSDRVRKEMYPRPEYSEQEKLEVYETMLRKAEGLARNTHVVLDGTFYREEIRSRFRNTLGGDGQFYLIEVRASEGMIRERLQEDRLWSDADFGVYRKIRGQWEETEVDHLVLQSTNHNIEEMLARAIKYLAG